jgi:uncharacterized protein
LEHINETIREYVLFYILPLYEQFDKAHNRTHVDRIIQNSLTIAQNYPVDINKVYLIAAYHDVGLTQGRENHEKTSAAYLLADDTLKQWFTKDELTQMAEAIEDHRASSRFEPRSIYGKIISEADRDIEYKTILTRCIEFSLAEYPDYTTAQHYERVYAHMQDKYGENGYLKLYLNSEPQTANLNEIRRILASPQRLENDFMCILPSLEEEQAIENEIAWYNSLPCEFNGFITVPILSDGEIYLVCTEKYTNPKKKHVPAYEFIICKGGERVGRINLRIGYGGGPYGKNLYYGGQIGYDVDEPFRGNNYAARACRLLVPVAKAHKMHTLLITNNPDNRASVRVCEKLGLKLIRTAPVPKWHDLAKDGDRYSNIYEWKI